MALQNRVTPASQIIAHPSKSAMFMGNRGILHDNHQHLGKARWRHKAWIICRTEFKGRKRRVMSPGRYTELFFLDEATALAAGHRPCWECRREAFHEFAAAWAEAASESPPRAGQMDKVLHGRRVNSRSRSQVTHRAHLSELPDGVFVRLEDAPAELLLLKKGRLLRWTAEGYASSMAATDRTVEVLTSTVTVAALGAGYSPELHPSAHRAN